MSRVPLGVSQKELYVAARRVLLDAGEALAAQRDALILVGAQAVYLRSGDADIPVARYTADADIGIDRAKLSADPKLLMRVSNIRAVSASFARLLQHEDRRIAGTAAIGLELLANQFGRGRGVGVAMATRTLAGALPPETIEALATAFTRGLPSQARE